MLLSPPFLPPRGAAQDDAAYLKNAMPIVNHGPFPVGNKLSWHGGLHLQAPIRGNGREPVRAIADGIVAYVRRPTARPASSGQAEAHALGYNGWTDDGCIIIRHDTTIGAQGNTETAVRFYSLYMHLNEVRTANVVQGQIIHRKDEIGAAGTYEGKAHILHFEVICDDDNLQRLIGRNAGDLDTHTDGRTDAVFGELYFKLPANTQIYPQRPALDQTIGANGTALGEELFVGVRYDGGHAHVTTYRSNGTSLGNVVHENDAEYNLYRDAGRIVAAYRTAGSAQVPAHSAVYELLRFGRVLGPDALNPANTPHWRQIATPTGQGWVNLNAAGIFRYSDADAPHWVGWHLMQDYRDNDSRCYVAPIRRVLDENGDGINTRAEAERRLGNNAIQNFLRGLVCKFPTEWQRAGIVSRWNWLITEGPNSGNGGPPSLEGNTYLSQADFPDFQRHVEALAFWEDAALEGIEVAHWHFHPMKFIEHFRKCGWLSLDELTQLLPRQHGIGNQVANIAWNTARTRFRDHQVHLNKIMRNYFIASAERQTHFLAQTYIETAMWSTMREIGRARQQRRRDGTPYWPAPAMEYYSAFYGRGIMQLTWAGNYESYGTYRQLPNLPADSNYADNRITATSIHYWANPRDRNGVIRDAPRQWHPRYDPENIADNPFNACDSGGHYWASKNIGGGAININRVCDRGITPEAVGRVSILVNGGSFGYAERQQYAAFISRYRGDSTDHTVTGTVIAMHGNQQLQVTVYYIPQRP